MKGPTQGFVRAMLSIAVAGMAGSFLACTVSDSEDLPMADAAPLDVPSTEVVADPGVFADLPVADAPTDATKDASPDAVMAPDLVATDADILASPDDAAPAGPRVEVVPPVVEFGGKKVGKACGVEVELRSVGTEPAVVMGIVLQPNDGAQGFGMDVTSLPGAVAPTADHPLSLAVNDSAKLLVTYTPSLANPRDASGLVTPDRVTLKITLLGGTVTDIPLSGFGVSNECPLPVLDIGAVATVLPQAVIRLDGSKSVGVGGPLVSWTFDIDQPAQNKFHLVQGATSQFQSHQANVAGDYQYRLDVCDASLCSNDLACQTTVVRQVTAAPTQAIHCELTWETPADTDQYDQGPGMGSDMDLHFLHPFATGPDLDGDGVPDGWFDIPYDVFWYNKAPEWESVNPNVQDNPSLDRDDTDGAGPENVNLLTPTDGRTYRIGVHYWDDQGFGVSFPRVRCFIEGTLALDTVLDNGGVGMKRCDLWEVATIEWPAKTVTPVTLPNGSPKVTPGYMNPAFVVVGGAACP